MKRIFAIISLLIFSLSFTPVELWHDCAHEHHQTEASHEHETVFDGEDCAVCDYHFSVYASGEIVSPASHFTVCEALTTEISSDLRSIEGIQPVNRGPPAIA